MSTDYDSQDAGFAQIAGPELLIIAPSKVGEWSLDPEPLGKGSFGVAYRVTREVVIGSLKFPIQAVMKLVNPDSRNKSQAKSTIIREMKNLSLLNSRFMPKLIDAGIFQDGEHLVPYLVMDFVDGASLRQKIHQQFQRTGAGLSPKQFKSLAGDSLRALGNAHSLDVMHLDIKPDNIIYSDKDDAFVLIDFGLATISTRDFLDKYPGGTMGYIAPEVYEYKTSKAADIFSLGVTFYQAITGHNPIHRALAKDAQMNGPIDPKDARRVQKAIPAAIFDFSLFNDGQRELIEPMLASNPSSRPSIARLIELADNLDAPRFDNRVLPAETAKAESENWSTLRDMISAKLDRDGVSDFKLTIDENAMLHLYFKAVTGSQPFAIICPRPANTLPLYEMGWKNASKGNLTLVFDPFPDSKEVASEIVAVLQFGFGVTFPISIT